MAVQDNHMTFPSFPMGWDKMAVHRKKITMQNNNNR